jgi:hypothetical protein
VESGAAPAISDAQMENLFDAVGLDSKSLHCDYLK